MMLPDLDDADQRCWAELAVGVQPETALSARAAREYLTSWPDAQLVSFEFAGSTFWYDTHDDPAGRESRTVAAWTRIPTHVEPRAVARQRRFPLAANLAARGYERGHLIARASGGGLDVNLFPQAWQINRGVGVEGQRFRRLERLAAATPGALQMTRLLWVDESNIPGAVHILVAPPGRPVEQAVVGNRPAPRPADKAASAAAHPRSTRRADQ